MTHQECSFRLSMATLVAFAVSMALPAHAAERPVEGAVAAATGQGADEVAPRPAKLPDLTKGEPLPPRPPKTGYMFFHMGPVGIVGIRNGNSSGDQIQVSAVTEGLPAETAKILKGDVILAVNGQRLRHDKDNDRMIGDAIIKAEEEAGKGIVKIDLWRDRNFLKRTGAKDVFGVDIDEMFKKAEGATEIYEWHEEEERTQAVKQMAYDEYPVDGFFTNATVQLEVMGTYSDDSPWDCPVVEKVRARAWEVIADRLRPDVRGRSKRGSSWPDVLALVASGKPEYVDIAKAWVHRLPTTGRNAICTNMNHKVECRSLHYGSWHMGFNPLEMAIYYDATGDDYVLPEIRYRAILTAMAQNGGGSWGHSFLPPERNGGKLHMWNSGYGAMNNSGGRCFFLLTLAKKAGIEDPEINAAIRRASRFFGTFIDKGCIPYGYHPPWPSDDSNGKNYGPAYAFYVLGDKYNAKYFSMHSAHASFTRRGGHGSWTLWYYTPLSAHMAGPRAVKTYMRNMRYFYTLSRRHDGSFVWYGKTACGVGTGWKGMRNPTATLALHLSRPLEQLIITGKDADPNFYMTDEELNELLLSARGTGKRGQIGDAVLLEKVGKPWPERSTAELLDLLDHFYPNMRRAIAAELGKRYAAGETGIAKTLVPLLGSDEARMRAGACNALSACGKDEVLANMSKVVKMLKDETEFVRMVAVDTMARATLPGDEAREIALLESVVDDYDGMSMDNGNVRFAVKSMLFKHYRDGSAFKGAARMGTEPFQIGYDEELVRNAFEKIVTMDPQGTVPGGWNKEALLKLAGPVTFSAAERQLNDAMFGGARKSEAQALLRKHGYREAPEGDAFNLIQRSFLERGSRRGVSYKDPFIQPKLVKQAPGRYRDRLDDLRLWQQDEPLRALSESNGKGKPPIITPLNLLIEIIEKDTDNPVPPSLWPEVQEMFKSELAAAGDEAAQLALCRKELDDLERKNYFRKMAAMSHLSGKLGVDALADIAPFLGHEHWRLREHAQKEAVALVAAGGAARLLKLFDVAQAQESGLIGNWNAAGILDALVVAECKPALPAAKGALKHADPVVRKAAVQATFALGGDAELKTVFAFMRTVASEVEDFHGVEQALLSRRDDPAHVQRVSKAAITLLPRSTPDVRRSLAWVLGQFGGEANLAAIQQAAETTEDDADLKEMALALAYSPDRAATERMLRLVQIDKRVRDVVSPLCIHRMVGPNGVGDVTDKERVKLARGVLNLKLDKGMILYMGRVHTGAAMQLLYDVMKSGGKIGRYESSTAIAAKTLIESAEGIRNPSKAEAALAAEVLTEVVEYIEVTHLRGGHKKHVKHRNDAGGYVAWKHLQARAGKALLKFHKPKEASIPTFDDMDLDI